MKLHRFIGNFDLTEKELLFRDPELVNQMYRVLRVHAGDHVILGDGNLNEAVAEVRNVSKNFILVALRERSVNLIEPKIYVQLYCSVLKRENFEMVVQKATEIGVKEIIPIKAWKTVKFGIKEGRLEKIAKEAAEQCGRGMVPMIRKPLAFADAMEDAKKNGLNFFFDASGEDFKIAAGSKKEIGRAGVFIGPEGGWDAAEIDAAQENGFQIIGLGKLTFRAETAALIASYLVISAYRV